MSEIPEGLAYSEDHEYMKAGQEEGAYMIGITDYAQGELGDIVYLELPSVGDVLQQKDTFGTIEAVKAVSDLFCPVAGEVLAVNAALEDDPSLVNSDPYGTGWMIKLQVADPSELDSMMDASGYEAFIGD